jgi:SAM-dependent methyltransferase
MGDGGAAGYWDERARENALYFVDTELDRDDPDEEAFWRGGEEVVDRLCEATGLALRGDETVPDIGCGVGRLSRALAERVERVIGLDVSQEMVRLAREHNSHLGNAEWLQGDGTSLAPVEDASVDGCLSHVVFQHIPDPEVTLGYVREMGRVLRPGGWALFGVSTDPEVHRRSLRRPRTLFMRPFRAPAWWGSAVDPAKLRAACVEAGLRPERVIAEGTQYTTVLARRLG